jgi:hypothetical protein
MVGRHPGTYVQRVHAIGGRWSGRLAAEEPWLAMVEDRKLVAHTYNERTAEQVRAHVVAATDPLRELGALLVRLTEPADSPA